MNYGLINVDHFQSAHSDPVENSMAVENVDNELNFSMLNREIVAQNDSCYEIYYADCDVANNTMDLSASNANSLPNESLDADGDVAFGTLIVRELQKMTPDAKRQFKRNVTQMIFS